MTAPQANFKKSWLESQERLEELRGEGCYYAHGKHLYQERVTCHHPKALKRFPFCFFEVCPIRPSARRKHE